MYIKKKQYLCGEFLNFSTMAKQVGLFGLRGKIENKSFYKTAGVEETVIRQIPEGLSSRVKTAAEYANTRLNNREFKDANWMASFLFNAVPNRRASMMRRFAIAEMTKGGLEYIKAGSGVWGNRIPTEKFDAIALDLLDSRAKSGPYSNEYGYLSYEVTNQTYNVEIQADEATVNQLISLGLDGMIVVSVRGLMASEITQGEVRQYFGHSSPLPTNVRFTLDTPFNEDVTEFIPGPDTLGMSQAGFTAALGCPNNGMFVAVSFIPYRRVGGSMYSLYEYATYAVLPLGALPV